jgi:hypothetical protein
MELSAWHAWWKARGGAGIRRVLMEEWDPIGVSGIPEAADEYDTYVGAVGELLHQGASAEKIEAYLREVREERMGLTRSPAEDAERPIATRLVEWYRDEMAADEPDAPSN